MGANGELDPLAAAARRARTGQLATRINPCWSRCSTRAFIYGPPCTIESNRVGQRSAIANSPGMAIRSVHGADVADWSIEDEPATAPDRAGQRLVVSLKTEVTTGTDVNIDSCCRDLRPAGAIGIEALEPVGVVRETGRLAIGCESHFRVRVDEADRLNQVSHEKLDPGRPAMAAPYSRLTLHRGPRACNSGSIASSRGSGRSRRCRGGRCASLRSLLTADVAGHRFVAAAAPGSDGAPRFGSRRRSGSSSAATRVSAKVDGELAIGSELVVAGWSRDSSQAEFVIPVVVEESQPARPTGCLPDGDLEAVLTARRRSIDSAALDGVLRVGDGPVHYAFQRESPPQGLCLRLPTRPPRLTAA